MTSSLLRRAAQLGALLSLAAGCAGSTINSGVAPRSFSRGPFYAGEPVAPDSLAIGHFPIVYQRGATQSPIFDPSGAAGTPVAALLAEMNAYLDSLGGTVHLAPATPPRGTAPDVRFGCEVDASGDCNTEDGGILGGNRRDLRIEIGRPSDDWVAWESDILRDANASRAILLTLELANYWPRQKGLSGRKEVELGTGYTMPIPWLTSLDTPVAVLQLTGALVDRYGRAIRIGAEGMYVRRTNLVMSALGTQALISDEDVEKVRTLRREDLVGAPIAWQVALRNLVSQLTGRSFQ